MDLITSTIPSKKPYADTLISNALIQCILNRHTHCNSFVFICIGTPKIPGDALGPAIGTQLKNLHLPNTFVYGTQEEPIHALNLTKVWAETKKRHPGSCFIAIDASFGHKSLLGSICVENRPIYPGKGVGKTLPPVGDLSITGIVCANCRRRLKRLEETALEDIYRQANIITHGIFQTIVSYFLLL